MCIKKSHCFDISLTTKHYHSSIFPPAHTPITALALPPANPSSQLTHFKTQQQQSSGGKNYFKVLRTIPNAQLQNPHNPISQILVLVFFGTANGEKTTSLSTLSARTCNSSRPVAGWREKNMANLTNGKLTLVSFVSCQF